MTHNAESDTTITGQSKLRQGDSFLIQFDLDEPGGDSLNLSRAEIHWKLLTTRERETVLTDESDYVTIIEQSLSDGRFAVRLDPEATENLTPSDYREVLEITDHNGDEKAWVGPDSVLIKSK